MMNNYDKLPYGEVIYEFKYEFPKKFGNRLFEFWDITIFAIIALCLPLFFNTINDDFCIPILQTLQYKAIHNPLLLLKFDNLISVFVLILAYGFMILYALVAVNVLFMWRNNRIILTDKGIFIKANGLLLYKTNRFYPYGTFSFVVHSFSSVVTLCGFWQFRVCDDIDKKFSFFDFRHSRFYCIAQNNEIQDMRKFLAILRERSAEVLESQGKAGKYDLKDKIKHLHRKDL
ncbi:hypothetical protein [Helicobacter sp. T3_23-1056]